MEPAKSKFDFMQSSKESIKNIIFDLGGVLLNIDYKRTVDAFGKLGLLNPDKAFTKEYQSDIFQKLEKGTTSELDFLHEISALMPGISNDQIIKAWCAILGDFPPSRYDMLKKLHKKYRLFILSNTNIIHQKAFEKTIDSDFGWKNFSGMFEAICYSHDLGCRKPDKEIFSMVLEKYNLIPQETLFIDDTEAHTLGAKETNIIVHHLKTHEEITEVFGEW